MLDADAGRASARSTANGTSSGSCPSFGIAADEPDRGWEPSPGASSRWVRAPRRIHGPAACAAQTATIVGKAVVPRVDEGTLILEPAQTAVACVAMAGGFG